MEKREALRDTPCAFCGHGHGGSDRFWNKNSRVFVERCGEWLSHWSLERVSFGPCECPEWKAPAYRCSCGLTSNVPFPIWLNGVRACRPDHALRGAA